ncbi:bifunctional phosphoribosyl-AMP cyclohydrolase/phosphoribosyl-ATP diphosphatase [Thermogymnomonas acidicola]|uniref:Histidine biosynthesis bifunctional protein HisIE n=1 Tax=Thermogymnomonas acidicola TaxID=399579 RepID=A0AA37F9N7_9ARCH|nr:bifunctional phosphoribosyl-AMP cyclohydrolase/phosphoribosyl-ATP diphosphatase HisIE [Thermogymnomonas acidicola]GGM75914.1 bifunctional phosphoribosyl-AMP cyclohydrolase/phosphoribosyl-ATP diphosphatase [Thermogymnomonas acidicola]
MSGGELAELISRIGDRVLPVVVQSVGGEVLTLAYANREALELTARTGYAHYYSRSMGRVRMKGEVSGNTQRVVEIRGDCDFDSLLYLVEQKGPACHMGYRTCFFRNAPGAERENVDYSLAVLRDLEDVIERRRREGGENSYTRSLFMKGREEVYKKFGEESIEVLLAQGRERIIYEGADMLYHFLVLLNLNGVKLSEIMSELSRRRR